jgi:putative lipoprotein
MLLFLQACSSLSEPKVSRASLDKPESIHPPDIIFRGQIVIGQETSSFTPCHSRQQYLMMLPNKQYSKVIALSPSPYQAIYGEVIGHLAIPSQTGFNADYRAKLLVKKINYIATDAVKECSRNNQDMQAMGNSPSWWVQPLSPASSRVLQVKLPDSTPQQWPITEIQQTPVSRIYQTESGQLKLSPSLCQFDQKTLYGWIAILNTDRNRYKGCARISNRDPSLSWVATYSATSTIKSNFSVTLRLFPDHSAQTRYQDQGTSLPIVENGFWQSLNRDQVQVVMTQHQQQYLLSQRIFTRQENHIHATREQVGQKIYPIADGGLTLYRDKP